MNIRKWTKLAKECYWNNYACDKCTAIPEDLKPECMVQEYAYASYKKFGKPSEDYGDYIETMQEIKKKNHYTFQQLADLVGINIQSLKNYMWGAKCSQKTIRIINKFVEECEYE